MAEDKKREFQEYSYITSGATKLYYEYFEGNIRDKVIVFLNCDDKYSGVSHNIADILDMPNIPVFALRGYKNSNANCFSDGVGGQNIEEFINHICIAYEIKKENIFIIAQSISAVAAAAWAHDYAPKIRGMAILSPAFRMNLPVPFANFIMIFAKKFCGRAKLFSKLHKTAKRIISDAHAIKLPMQILISGRDHVVRIKPEHIFFDNLGSKIKEKYVFDKFRHDILGEDDSAKVIEIIKSFIDKLYSMPLQVHDYTYEDRWSVTADILRELQSEPACYLKRVSFKITTWAMKTFGNLSDGIKLGLETGFDSGSTLDYVYRNKPSGKLFIGKFMDWVYLNSAGWNGIKQRKVNIEKIIKIAINKLKTDNKPIRITDIAAGHGRYILEAIGDAKNIDSVLFRDYSELNVEKGTKLIKEKGLEDKVKFVLGNAFDRQDLGGITPAPTVAIVSGLYELFPYNDNIRESLMGLSDVLESGSYLIYTDQPWHPQLEFIARVLTSHRQGQAWAMRCRTQGEMDFLVEEAGFEKVMQLCDEEDIFSVSLARKK